MDYTGSTSPNITERRQKPTAEAAGLSSLSLCHLAIPQALFEPLAIASAHA